MGEIIQLLVCCGEVVLPLWFINKWVDKRERGGLSFLLWYTFVGICIAVISYQRYYALYSRWFLFWEIFTVYLMMKWRWKVRSRDVILFLAILYESIYMMDLLMLILDGYYLGNHHMKLTLFGENNEGVIVCIISQTIVFVGLLFIHKKRRGLLLLYEKNWRLLYLVPVIQHMSLFQCDKIFTETGNYDIPRSLFVFCIIIIGLVLFLMALYIWKKSEYEKILSEERVNAAERRYQELLEDNKERDILVHDIRNHMLVLEGILKRESKGRALAYIEEIRKESLSLRQRSETGNVVVDTILNEKIRLAEENGIEIKIISDDLRDSFVTDRDWCSILANLFDNAIEACRRVEGNRWIRVCLEKQQFGIVINIANNYDREEEERKVLVSPKKDGRKHGIGLQSVRSALESYGGTMVYECKNNKFCVNIVLYR